MWCHVCTAIQEQGMEALIAGTDNKGGSVCREFKNTKPYEKSSAFYFQDQGKQ